MVDLVGPARCVRPFAPDRRRRRQSSFKISLPLFAALTTLVALAGLGGAGVAETGSPLAPGDLGVSGFSGTVLSLESLPPGVAPVDKTVIDPDGAALTVYDVSNLGSALSGQLVSPPVKFKVPAKDIGQVYSLVFDLGADRLSPALYAGATSAYGLNIVGAKLDDADKSIRLKQGEAGAKFMDGQFGAIDRGGPGAIWKIDGATGEAELFADTRAADTDNSGPALGGLAIDPASRSLYAADLDTGLVHRFALDGGRDLGQFDHGVTGRPARAPDEVADDGKRADIASPSFKADDPATWGFTQEGRRVRALAVHDGRLYYSVDEGPEIWSVGLGEDGAFAEDARSELEVETDEPLIVPSIAFDTGGNMILGTRRPLKASYDYTAFVEPGAAKALRYTLELPDDPATPGIWSTEAETYSTGMGPGNAGSSGGAAMQYAYTPDGVLATATCGGSLALSTDAVAEDGSGHGAQIGAPGAVEPADAPKTSAFVNFDAKQDSSALLGHAGDVEAFQNCPKGGGFPDVAGGFPPVGGGGGGFPPVGGGGFPPIGGGGGGGFPPIGGGGGSGFPPVDGGEGGTLPPVEEGGGGGKEAPGETAGTTRRGNLVIAKKGLSPDCGEATTCNYTITVENTGDAFVPGPVILEDTLSAGATPLAAAKITQLPGLPWSCSSASPKFTCVHQGPIPPKTVVPLTIGFNTGPIGDAKEVKNCALPISLPVEQIPAGPGTTIKGNLQFTLNPLASKCPVSALTDQCEWEAKITNVGAEPVTGPAKLRFLYSYNYPTFGLATGISTIKSQSGPAGTTCAIEGNVVNCTNPQFSIAPKETVSIRLTPALTTSRPEILPDTKSITGDLMATVGTVPAADVRTFMTVNTPGAVDPPPPLAPMSRSDNDLKIETVPVSGQCSAAAGGCEWDITFSNTGAAPLTGILSFTQFFLYRDLDSNSGSIAPTTIQSTTSTPAVTCKADRTNEISCRIDDFTLEPKQSFTVRTRAKFDPPEVDEVAVAVTLTITGSLAGKGGAAESSLFLDQPFSPGGGGATTVGGAGAPGDAAPGGANADPQAPSAPACVVTPTSQPQPGEAPPPQPAPAQVISGKVSIAKTAVAGSCTGSPQVCNFTVTVTNGTDKAINGPVEFTDDLTGDGAFLGSSALTIVPEPWICPKQGQSFKCTATLQLDAAGGPNASKSFNFSASHGAGVGAVKEMKNCATIEGLPASCVTHQLANGPLLRIRKQEFGCDPGAQEPAKQFCQFIVTIENHGTAPFTGPVAFSDSFDEPGAGVDQKPGSTTATTWTCAGPASAFSCESGQVTIEPNGRANAVFLLEPKTRAATFTNCATLTGQGAVGSDKIKECVTVEGLPPAPPPVLGEPKEVPLIGNLKAVITAATPECPIAGPCVFNASLLSTGAGVTFNGQLDAVVAILGGTPANIQAAGAAFACERQIAVGGAPGPTVLCQSQQKTLPDGQSLPFTITVSPGATWQKNNIVKACLDVVSAQDSNKADNQACAEAKLDPFKVKIAKSGHQACAPGSSCTFELDIFNDEKIVHDDPVTVIDNLVGLESAEIVSITAANDPFPCAPAPATLPFSCTGNMVLDPGEHNKYTMVVKVPAKAPEQGWFSNCAAIGDNDPAAPGPTATGGTAPAPAETACHVVSTAPQCTSGMEPTKDGKCACPAGTSWNGTECAAPKQVCPEGTSGTYPDCESLGTGGAYPSMPSKEKPKPQQPKPQQPVKCPKDRPVGTPPNCCPKGMSFSKGACRCPQGTDLINGVCRVPPKQKPQTQEPKVCPADRPVGTYPNCCPKGTIYSRGQCRSATCPPGTVGKPPICIPQKKQQEKPKPRDCGPGYRALEKPNKYGAYCEPIDQGPPKCPADRPNGTPPNCCPPGTRFTEGNCYPTQCSPGWTGSPPHCQPPAPKPQPVPPAPKKVCPSYMQGTYPNCHCPSGLTGDRCQDVIVR